MSNKAKLDAAIAAAEAKYGDLPPGYLAKIAKVESAYGEKLVNPKSSARGPFQFMEATGPEFGLVTEEDRLDFDKSTDAAARLSLRNKAQLEKALGRPATAGELYLAHQQGAGGALKLLRNPNAKAADVVGAQRVKLNGGSDTMTAGEFAGLWVKKVDGGAATAPGKKPESEASLAKLATPQSIPSAPNAPPVGRDYYSYDPSSLGRLRASTEALRAQPKVVAPKAEPIDIGSLLIPRPQVDAPGAKPTEDTPKSRTDTAILEGLSTFGKSKERLADQLDSIAPVRDTVAGPSGIPGTFSAGVTSGLMNINADLEYFGAIVDTLTGNEAGKQSRLYNARQFETDSARALAGMESFEEFLAEPTFGGFITQIVSSAGQVAPSAAESIVTALFTGGMYTLAKAGITEGTKAVGRALLKDLVVKKAKGATLDKTEDAILEGLYRNFKHGAIAGAFGSEYRMMSGGAFAEFGDAGVDLDADRALQSLLIGLPQAAIGVGGEAAIMKMLGDLALKKAPRTAGQSVLKRFAADTARMAAKSGAVEGLTEVAQEGISVGQRFAVDPNFTMEDAQLRIAQAAFSGFFGGGAVGGGAGAPAAAASAIRNAGNLLKGASEARAETKATAEMTGVSDAALAGATAPESVKSLNAQLDLMMQDDSPKPVVWAAETQEAQFEIDPGAVKEFTETREGPHKDKKFYVGNIPGRGNIISKDLDVVESVMAEYELGGDVDAAIGRALGMVGGKDGTNVVRVRDGEGNTLREELVEDELLDTARENAAAFAAKVPGAVVDEPVANDVLNERVRAVSFEKGERAETARVLQGIADSISDEEAEAADNADPEDTVDEDSGLTVREMSDDKLAATIENYKKAWEEERKAKTPDGAVMASIEDAITKMQKAQSRRKKFAPAQSAAREKTDPSYKPGQMQEAVGVITANATPEAKARLEAERAKRAKQDPDVKYSRGKSEGSATVEQVKQEAEASFSGVKHLFKNGALRIEEKPSDGIDPSAQAVTDEDGIVTIYAANTSPGRVRGLILHEVGAHVGMREVMGEAEFKRLLEDVYSGVHGFTSPESDPEAYNSGNLRKRIDAARARGITQNETLRGIWEALSEEDRYSPHAMEEVLGHFLEDVKDGPLLTRILTRLKMWLRKHAPAMFKNKPLSDQEILEFAKAAVRAESNKAKKAKAPKAMTLKDKVIGKGNPDAEGFITSAEKAMADPAPRFRDAKKLTPAQWRKFFREAGATKEAFKYQIEPALEGAKQDAQGRVSREDVETGMAKHRTTLIGESEHEVELYKQFVARGPYENYMQRAFRISKAAMKRFIGEDTFVSHNWPWDNVVLHIRTTDRKTTDGRDVKFVEELQSDAQQEGAQYGRKGESTGGKAPDNDYQSAFNEYKRTRERLEEFLRAVGITDEVQRGDLVFRYRGAGDGSVSSYIAGIQLTDEQFKQYDDLDIAFGQAETRLEDLQEAAQEAHAMGEKPPGPVARMPMEYWEGPAVERALLEAVRTGINLVTFPRHATLPSALKTEGTKAFYDERLPKTIARVAAKLGAKVTTVELLIGPVISEDLASAAKGSIQVGDNGRAYAPDPVQYIARFRFNGRDYTTTNYPTAEAAHRRAERDIGYLYEGLLANNGHKEFTAVVLTEAVKRKLQDGVVMYSRPGFDEDSQAVDDEGELVDENTEGQADTQTIEDALNVSYGEIDAKMATRIEQFVPREPKQDQKEEAEYDKKAKALWLKLAQVVPDGEQYERYKQFQERMPIKMLESLIRLNEANNDDGGLVYYDVAEDKAVGSRKEDVLSITQRDPFPDSDTTVTREAVRDVLKQVAKMPGDLGKLRHAKTKGLARDNSQFWLVNRNTGKAMRLNGTPKTKKKKGRTGVAMLADAGRILNTRTKQNLQGAGMTKAEQHGQGLQTMLKELMIAGYDLKVGEMPAALIPFDPKRLPRKARDEVVFESGGVRGGITDLLYTTPPAEISTSDFDAGTIREELSDTTEVVTPTETVRGREATADGRKAGVAPGAVLTQDRAPRVEQTDQAAQFAIQEDKKKRRNEEERLRPAQLAAPRPDLIQEMLPADERVVPAPKRSADSIMDEAVERRLPEYAEAELDPIPADVTIKIKKVGDKWEATVSSPRHPRRPPLRSKDKAWVEARAHKLAVSLSDTAPVRFNRLAMETLDSTDRERTQHNEISGIATPKDQTSVKDTGKVEPGANSVKVLGNIGKLTGRILSLASSKFNFARPLTVVTLKHLTDNFDALTGPGMQWARARDSLADAVDQMNDPARDEPGRILMGNQYVIILRDEPLSRLSLEGDDILSPDDARIGAALAHEIGHIVFEQDFEKHINQGPQKSMLWKGYQAHAKQMEKRPAQYTDDKAGFEEWYSDQVMAFVYNEARQAGDIVSSYFKRLAKALREFYHRVNEAMGGRLKLAMLTGKSGKPYSFTDYMEVVVKRHAAQRAANNTLPMADQMKIRSLNLNVAARVPAAAARRVSNAARNLMTSGSTRSLTHSLMNIVHASTDFMGLTEHGAGGANLKTFFGTLSQSMDKLGWNKRSILAQNKWHNRLADIFGITDQSDPAIWTSPATEAILKEAMNESIDDVNLSTPEAKAVRKLYAEIKDKYLTNPSGRNRNRYYIKDFTPRNNYGGPLMWNAEKIARNEAEFVSWLASQLPRHGNPVQRAKDIFDRITLHQGKPGDKVAQRVEQDNQTAIANGRPAMTPVERAAAEFRMSMLDNAVVSVRERILRDARNGRIDPALLFDAIQAQDPTNQLLLNARSNPIIKAQINALEQYWREETRIIRFTPGMDPALKRHLGEDVNSQAAYDATPGDPNGWLLPPAKAHAQYMHYIARRVEYEKLGIERGHPSGAKYVIEQIKQIPAEYQGQVDDAIMANLGKVGESMGPWWRAANSIAAVWTVFTTLLFTTLTSVTDLAGIATRSKEFGNLGNFISMMRKTLSDREFQDLARSVGVVTGRTQEHMLVGQGELDYANSTARSLINGFFRYTGLEFYTKFVRSLSVGMGREFIINTATRPDFDAVKHTQWLAELGLTKEEVTTWLDNFQLMDTPEGEKVATAIARFAEESVIRPDASQRPTWASNPYLQMVWQLKSYYYGFGKTVLGGLGREIRNRYTQDGNFNGAAASVLLLAVTILPLAMFGLASREWMKWLFQLAIPGLDETPSMTQKMDGIEYMWEITKRSGVFGPFALGITTMEAFKWEGIGAPFTANVPMFDLFDDMIFDGDLTRGVPVLNNVK